jgi:hypothetical protein
MLEVPTVRRTPLMGKVAALLERSMFIPLLTNLEPNGPGKKADLNLHQNRDAERINGKPPQEPEN